MSRCVRRPRPPLRADLARLRSLDHLRTHFALRLQPGYGKNCRLRSAAPPHCLPVLQPAALEPGGGFTFVNTAVVFVNTVYICKRIQSYASVYICAASPPPIPSVLFFRRRSRLFLSLSANPCSNTGSGFPSKTLINHYQTVRYTPFEVLQPQTPKMSVRFFRFYVIKHTPTTWYSV